MVGSSVLLAAAGLFQFSFAALTQQFTLQIQLGYPNDRGTVEGDGFRQLATQGLQLYVGRGHGQVVFFQQPVGFIRADTLVTDQLDCGKPGALCQEKLLLQGADIAQGLHLQGDLSIGRGACQQRCGIQYAAGNEGGQCHFFE
ncbi:MULTISPECIES: hypothetical protein [Pseudomonas]|uniref:hypothetical protein n=1 Tax=Pseudomonas TaxID=286 RepID=UPI00216720A7|nr:hypothetical protein [Pseudomonas grimontii]MCS3514359.1 hypothetical protein [Pseudomonas grimontii]